MSINLFELFEGIEKARANKNTIIARQGRQKYLELIHFPPFSFSLSSLFCLSLPVFFFSFPAFFQVRFPEAQRGESLA